MSKPDAIRSLIGFVLTPGPAGWITQRIDESKFSRPRHFRTTKNLVPALGSSIELPERSHRNGNCVTVDNLGPVVHPIPVNDEFGCPSIARTTIRSAPSDWINEHF